jgi:hypothetical protein
LTADASAGIVGAVLNRLKRPVVALVLVLCVGLHWPLLQSVAWMSMLVSYSREAGFEQAISNTFDGKHPCKICKLVQEGKKAEQHQAHAAFLKKEQAACFFSSKLFIGADLAPLHTPYRMTAISRHDPPPHHPPAAA